MSIYHHLADYISSLHYLLLITTLTPNQYPYHRHRHRHRRRRRRHRHQVF
jgi:hypothetical protein